MSIAKGVPGPDGPAAGQKVILPRGTAELWNAIEVHWIQRRSGRRRTYRWKALAMLHLYSHCNWTLEMIGEAFGQHRGRVHRLIHNARASLAETFDPPPPELSAEDDDDER